MLKHEQHEKYEELSVLAWSGEASARELDELREHLRTCSDCRRHYESFTKVVVPQLSVLNDPILEISPDVPSYDWDAVRSSTFKRAQAIGFTFSAEALTPQPGRPASILKHKALPGAVAALLLIAIGIGGYWFVYLRFGWTPVTSATPVASIPRPVESGTIATPAAGEPVQRDPSPDDRQRIALLERRLRDAESERDETRTRAAHLASVRSALDEQLTVAQQQDHASQETVAALRLQVVQLQNQANSDEASFLADEVHIKQLEGQVSDERASLERERQTTGATHEVGNLMAARNLHIVDVYDTDAHGATKPIFGRIFFAENKQLLFYAYDLDESRLKDAKYIYRIWGEKHGADQSAKALGIFYSDDETQKRWAFKYDDPKVLSEIDSVFVTLEPTNKKISRPRGQQLMYAFLRGPVNHP